MDRARLESLLSRFPETSVLVFGDFFLDRYLIIDPDLSEPSLETGLDAYQVIDTRCFPGAAGTVTSNLRALGVKTVALGFIGDDGEGYELKQGLTDISVDVDLLIDTPDRLTPTYTKPMTIDKTGAEREINRLDIKNRTPTPPHIEDQIIQRLRSALPELDGVIVADQVEEPDCGVITAGVRAELADLARKHRGKYFFVDSRAHIGRFRNAILKPNRREASRAIHPEWDGGVDGRLAERCGRALFERTRMPVYLTMSEEGLLLITEGGSEHIRAVCAEGEIDPVGAGDSTTAGIVSALCGGATHIEAATIGVLVASITVHQVGVTGTASPEQVLKHYEDTT